jgi:peptide deformylase
MAILKIYTFPDDILTKKASPIGRVDREIHGLADQMLETMYDAPGIGLAANQVGILQRILVLDTDYDLEEIKEGAPPPAGVEVVGKNIITNRKPQILINPEIIFKEGKTAISEGCLSVPEFTAEVDRFEKLKLRYQDIDGLSKIISADGILAIAIQHELDHLDGKLFIDRLSPLKKEKVRKMLREERILRETLEREGRSESKKSRKKRDFET